MINKIIILGNLGKDPELRQTVHGRQFAQFTVATNERYTDPRGERQIATEWHTCKVWGQQAENAVKLLKKGSTVYIEGSSKSYESNDNKKLWEIRVKRWELLDKRETQTQNSNYGGVYARPTHNSLIK